MKYRNEWKFTVGEYQLQNIRSRLNSVLHIDDHSDENGRYDIHSLYFDDYKNSCVLDNEAGVNRRYKWRIRYYGDDIRSLTLERKEKYNGMCLKRSCRLSLNDYEAIVSGNVQDIIWEDDCDPLLKYFCKDIINRLYRPKIIIDYNREAFVEEVTNIRITFDRNISASLDVDEFLTGDYLPVPLMEKDIHVLEVKFDDILPSNVRQACHLSSLNQGSFSKYYTGMKKLGRI